MQKKVNDFVAATVVLVVLSICCFAFIVRAGGAV